MATRRITAKFPGTCRNCHARFPAGTEILWSTNGGGAVHASACESPALKPVAGTSFEAARGVAEMDPETEAAVAWNVSHGLCPDGCCGSLKSCGDPDCRCFSLARHPRFQDPGRFEPNHWDEV